MFVSTEYSFVLYFFFQETRVSARPLLYAFPMNYKESVSDSGEVAHEFSNFWKVLL